MKYYVQEHLPALGQSGYSWQCITSVRSYLPNYIVYLFCKMCKRDVKMGRYQEDGYSDYKRPIIRYGD